MGKDFRYYHINRLCADLGELVSISLPMFHCLTGCDTTSSFMNIGKKKAWKVWMNNLDLTDALVYIAEHPFTPVKSDSSHFQKIEQLVVKFYDAHSSLNLVNAARKILFCERNSGSVDRIPPTQDALEQHVKRAVFQASIWITSDSPTVQIPSPDGYGWRKDGNSWRPLWITIPEVAAACRELIKCRCSRPCKVCNCLKAGLPCTALCRCACEK